MKKRIIGSILLALALCLTLLPAEALAANTTNILSYNDILDISEYAVDAMEWAVGAEIMQGYEGKLMPQEPCTRAQIVTILYRLLGE